MFKYPANIEHASPPQRVRFSQGNERFPVTIWRWKVPGGWLVMPETELGIAAQLAFVPDEAHVWDPVEDC